MSSHGGKKANLAKFHERAIAISQDKNEDGTRAAITAVIIGGGPAGMIAALALVHAGLRVIICEEQPAFTVDEPEAGQAHGPSEPLVLSAHSVSQLCEWGMPKRDLDGIKHADMGPHAREVRFRDLRSLTGRLLRREANEGHAIRAQDLCCQIHKVLTAKSKANALKVKSGHFDPKDLASYERRNGVKVLDMVDITWGVAAYLSNGQSVAGDLLIGADGIESVVRAFVTKANPNARDTLLLTGYTQWQGALRDEAGVYAWFTDAIHIYLGSQSMSMVYRVPNDIVSWTVLRPTSLEGANQLQEWKTMMSSWPVDDDGSVSIPHEETMLLRAAFDLFDADKSGALDYSEVRTAMESCGMTLTDKEIHDMAAHIDKDGSGTFEFAEFIELVKVLLVRLREAQEAADSIEDMLEVMQELEEQLRDKNQESKRLAHTVFEMRKGGAQGKLDVEQRLQEIPDEIADIQRQMTEARQVVARAKSLLSEQAHKDQLEYDVAKSSLGKWLRAVNSHMLLRRLVLSTGKPQRTTCVERGGILSLAFGRVALIGQAAHPLAPGTFLAGNECVKDAQELIKALAAHELPDGLPDALATYSSARRPAAAYATKVASELQKMYCKAGVDWDKLSEDEVSHLIDYPTLPYTNFKTHEELEGDSVL